MTGTLRVTPNETVIRFDNGNSIHQRGNAITVWGKGGVILWQSKTPAALNVAITRATRED